MTGRGVCRLPQGRGREIHDAFASRGVSARYYAGGALADCLRVSVGTASDADKLIVALKSALGWGGRSGVGGNPCGAERRYSPA